MFSVGVCYVPALKRAAMTPLQRNAVRSKIWHDNERFFNYLYLPSTDAVVYKVFAFTHTAVTSIP